MTSSKKGSGCTFWQQAAKKCILTLFFLSTLTFAQPIEIEIIKKITPIKTPGMIQVTLYHTNNIQGHVWPFSEEDNPNIGGLAQLYSLIRPYHSRTQIFDDEIVLLLDTGNFSTGTPANDFLNSSPILTAMNAMGYTAAALGTRELDRGISFFEHQRSKMQFPILSANAFKADQPFATPYVISTIRNVRIGIVGLNSQTLLQHATHPSIQQLKVQDPIKTARAVEEKIHKQTDLLIALTHSEIDASLAKTTKHFDVILGGGTSDMLEDTLIENDKIILRAGSDGKALGVLVLILNPKKNYEIHHYSYKLLPINLKIPLPPDTSSKSKAKKFVPIWKELYPDREIQRSLTPARQSFDLMTRQTAGLSNHALPLDSKSSILGHFVADAMREFTQSQIAFIDHGALKSGLPKGTLTYGNLMSVCPSISPVIQGKITGQNLQKIVQHMQSLPDSHEGRLHMSGLKITGSQITLRGKPLQTDQTYTFATTAYLATSGAYGYTALKEAEITTDTGFALAHVLFNSFQKRPVLK